MRRRPSSGGRFGLWAFAVAIHCLLPGSVAQAQQVQVTPPPATQTQEAGHTHRLQWRSAWGERLWPELTVAGVMFGAAAPGQFGVQGTAHPRWTRHNGFDTWFRGGLKRNNEHARLRRAGVALWHISEFWALAVDAVLVAWVADRNTRTALHLLAMDLQSLSLSAFTTVYTRLAFARQRPGRDCQGPGGCGHPGSAQSFFSGHTSMAFTGASLVCLQHRYLPLYGGGWPDALACGVGLAAATTTGIFRVVNDAHWVSDVVVGAAVGFAFGWLLPWAQHFRHGAPSDERGWAWLASPWASSHSLGATFALRH